MKNLISSLLILWLSISINTAKAQDFLSFVNDNYAGSTAMFYNPAAIVDSRYKFDMELLGISNRIDNNWVKIDKSVLLNWVKWKESDFKNNHMSMDYNGLSKNAYLGVEGRALSFLTNYNHKNAFGFSARARVIMNFDNLPESAAILIFNGNNVDSLMSHHTFENMSQELVSWAEYGLTYGRILTEDESKHFFKIGASAKLLQGIAGIYLYEKYMDYNLKNADTATNVVADIKFGLTGSVDDIRKFKFTATPAIGFDFGFVYEWRPKTKEFKYAMNGKTDLWRNDLNKYKLRIGFSVLDIGSMKFKKQYKSGNITIDDKLVNFALLHAPTLIDLADTINRLYGTELTDSYFHYRLPTTLNLSVDYNILKYFYVSLSGRLALNQGNNHYEKAHYLNNISIIPRYEKKWWGVSIPIKYNQFGFINVGMGLRMGPIWLGSSDLTGLIGLSKKVMGADIHLAIKIPIYYKSPADKDGDLVSDDLDICPTEKGTWELKGCPDDDNDGIVNSLDNCPTVAGLVEFNGCPDSDKDGVQDKYDKCPDIYGEIKYSGCPDSDGDNIIDINDSCPKIAGLEKFNGCPDTDGDGIPDVHDDCPEVFGIEFFNGCPDTDGDGIRDVDDLCPTVYGLDSLYGCPYIDTDNDGIQDKYDKCPKIAGPKENSGCPYLDTDHDGVLDKDDLCPMTPGPVSNNGCPIIELAEQNILDTAFANLEFETAMSIIKSTSYESLIKIADLMKRKPEFKLLIEGHTDNIGKDAANMSLSQNRALAVKYYLIKNGISESRINAKWYGETKPIWSNETEEGRQKNRRVEMSIIFD
ncbi:MAG: hypothetical protein AUJ98_02650 [Bacteroidetes bacterium CG2_30_33_31]|nr:MAG: hypothetical protein AUJ98_02650 [Bacteroidetes bacterium CG2_30_33_31]